MRAPLLSLLLALGAGQADARVRLERIFGDLSVSP